MATDTNKRPRVTKRERELQVKLDTANSIIEAQAATIAQLTSQITALVQAADGETSAIVGVQLKSNGAALSPLATEIRVGTIVLRAPDGAIITRSKSSKTFRVANMSYLFDGQGHMTMPGTHVPTFIERAQAVGWVQV